MKKIFNNIKSIFSKINFKSKKTYILLIVIILAILGVVLYKSYAYYTVTRGDSYATTGKIVAQKYDASVIYLGETYSYSGGVAVGSNSYMVLTKDNTSNWDLSGYLLNKTKTNCTGNNEIKNYDMYNDGEELPTYITSAFSSKGVCYIYLDINESNPPNIITEIKKKSGDTISTVSSFPKISAVPDYTSNLTSIPNNTSVGTARLYEYTCQTSSGTQTGNASTTNKIVDIHDNKTVFSSRGNICSITYKFNTYNGQSTLIDYLLKNNFSLFGSYIDRDSMPDMEMGSAISPSTHYTYQSYVVRSDFNLTGYDNYDTIYSFVGNGEYYDYTDNNVDLGYIRQIVNNETQFPINNWVSYNNQKWRILGFEYVDFDSDEDEVLDKSNYLMKIYYPFTTNLIITIGGELLGSSNSESDPFPSYKATLTGKKANTVGTLLNETFYDMAANVGWQRATLLKEPDEDYCSDTHTFQNAEYILQKKFESQPSIYKVGLLSIIDWYLTAPLNLNNAWRTQTLYSKMQSGDYATWANEDYLSSYIGGASSDALTNFVFSEMYEEINDDVKTYYYLTYYFDVESGDGAPIYDTGRVGPYYFTPTLYLKEGVDIVRNASGAPANAGTYNDPFQLVY